MSRFYTENKAMYFEVQESEASIHSNNRTVFTIHAYYKNAEKDYRYEREIPEGIFFKNEIDAKVVAESLSWVFNWGVEATKDTLIENVKNKLINTFDSL